MKHGDDNNEVLFLDLSHNVDNFGIDIIAVKFFLDFYHSYVNNI